MIRRGDRARFVLFVVAVGLGSACELPRAFPVVDDLPRASDETRADGFHRPRAIDARPVTLTEGFTRPREVELPRPSFTDTEPPAPPPPVVYPKPCDDLFADEVLQTFEIEIDPSEWAKLERDFARVGLEEDEYRPLLLFKHGDEQTTDAMIRLRGNKYTRNEQRKMQFQISFNETDKDGRFRGLRKIVLDANHFSKTYMRDRLAMSMARDAGLPASCVNHARLYVNGQFYGLYSSLEKIDREFLERNFENPEGNLWEKGDEQKTNEDIAPDEETMELFWDATDATRLAAMSDLNQMIRAWAVEAIMPDADGYWAGGWNFYLYDHPERGLLYLLWDVDQSFDSAPVDADPVTWHKTNSNFNGRPHVEAVLNDPHWRQQYISQVRAVRESLDEQELLTRIDRWAEQIRDSAYEDQLAPWTGREHEEAVEDLREHISERLEFIDDWLEEHDPAGGSEGEPGDGTGAGSDGDSGAGSDGDSSAGSDADSGAGSDADSGAGSDGDSSAGSDGDSGAGSDGDSGAGSG